MESAASASIPVSGKAKQSSRSVPQQRRLETNAELRQLIQDRLDKKWVERTIGFVMLCTLLAITTPLSSAMR
jgi:hypothetical protein